MLDLNAFADKTDFYVLGSVILEIWDLKAVETGLKLDPGFGEAAPVPVEVKEELPVKEQF